MQCPKFLKSLEVKRPLSVTAVEDQRFRRSFVWDEDITMALISPLALNTKTAFLLSSPPQHLLDNLIYKATLKAFKDNIRVKTLFNVDKFKQIL